jgi:hypothetical protein
LQIFKIQALKHKDDLGKIDMHGALASHGTFKQASVESSANQQI